MNTRTLLRTTAAILSLAATASAFATTVQLNGDDMYDRIAQSRSQVTVNPAADATARTAVGGYARQLMYLGVEARQAVKIARSVGEQPLSVSVVPQQRAAGGFDLYDRVAARKADSSTTRMTTAVR